MMRRHYRNIDLEILNAKKLFPILEEGIEFLSNVEFILCFDLPFRESSPYRLLNP